MQVGDYIIVVSEKIAYKCEIIQLGEEVRVKQTGEIVPSSEMPIHVTIACGLPKGDKLDLIAQKGTELGMYSLIPFTAQRSIVKWDEKKSEKKVERLQKIAQEAAEQSHRTVVPKIESLHSFSQLVTKLKNYDIVFLADEEDAKSDKRTRFFDQLKFVKDNELSSILIIFGPEGGISRKEAEILLESGVQTISLGPRILRAETAPLYALSAISYEYE